MSDLPRIVSDMFSAKVTWGDELTLALRRAGGLQPVAKRLRETLGFLAPSRATLAKLQKVESPASLNEEDAFRAYLVLVAIGEDPQSWQLPAVSMPSVFDREQFERLVRREGLEPPTRWLRALAVNGIGHRVRRESKPLIIPRYGAQNVPGSIAA